MRKSKKASTAVSPLTIEKGVPFSTKKPLRHQSRTRIYPFDTMKRGDSFLIKPNGRSAEQQQNIVSTSARFFTKTHPRMKFATRQVDGGVRVWRTA